jgi:6-phosphogluconolactonase
MRLILALVTCFFFVCGHSQERWLLVGTYDSPKSEGIYVFKFNTATGQATEVSHVKTPNPSFITVSKDGNFVYAVSETAPADGKGGDVAAFTFNKQTGELTFLNKQPSGGDHPCHVELDKTGTALFVANYSSGSLSVLPVMMNGTLGAPTVIKHEGSGPHPRQKSPHVHGNTISPDNKFVLTTDLGTDQIVVYSFDQSNGKLKDNKDGTAKSKPGSGPRLSTFHPNGKVVYVIEELSGHVAVYNFKKGKLAEIQRIRTTHEKDTGAANSAHVAITPDGKYLFATNRGEFNSVAMFEVRASGKLDPIAYTKTNGKTPRNFTIDPTGKLVLIANQNSDEVYIFKIDDFGLLIPRGKFSVGRPVCLKWVE